MCCLTSPMLSSALCASISLKVIIMFWWEFGLSFASRNQFTTFCRPSIHYACLRLCSAIVHSSETIVLLINGGADRSGYITNFCSVIELLHEFKKRFFKHGRIQEVDNVSAGKSENWQFAGLLRIIKNWKFSCVLHAHSQFLWSLARFDHANRGVRQPVQPHTFYARLLVFDKTSAASFCSCKLFGRSDGCVLLPVLTCSLIILHLWTAVSWRWYCIFLRYSSWERW